MSNQLATQALHAGHDASTSNGTQAVPIYQTTSYVFKDSHHAANLFSLAEPGFIYTRLNNPTNDVLEQRLAAMEGGVAAVATASGTAAIATTLMVILKTGDHIVASSSLYGGTYNLLSNTLPRFGITSTFVDPDDAENFTKAIKSNTRLFFSESLGNPKLDVLDLKAISIKAKEAKVPFIVDNTVATPYLLNPIEHGANIVIHSLTKFINGTSDCVAGSISSTKDFISQLSDVNNGMCMLLGPVLDSFRSASILKNIHTLHIRMQQHSKNAQYISEGLENLGIKVMYPGLKSHPDNHLVNKYMNGKASSVMSFGIKGGIKAGGEFIDKLKLIVRLVNIGDAKSLACHPASTTHRQLNKKELEAAGVPEDMVRLSIGIEHIDDIIEDLSQALK